MAWLKQPSGLSALLKATYNLSYTSSSCYKTFLEEI